MIQKFQERVIKFGVLKTILIVITLSSTLFYELGRNFSAIDYIPMIKESLIDNRGLTFQRSFSLDSIFPSEKEYLSIVKRDLTISGFKITGSNNNRLEFEQYFESGILFFRRRLYVNGVIEVEFSNDKSKHSLHTFYNWHKITRNNQFLITDPSEHYDLFNPINFDDKLVENIKNVGQQSI